MSFKKADKLARRIHKERRQPKHRQKLGYLEKKKDYKKRAEDHHAKETRIKQLKNKALDRNPNEFVFHMINSRLIDGVHYELPKDELTPDKEGKILGKEKLCKNYNETLLQKRQRRKKEEKHVDEDRGVKNKHTFFV